MNNITLDVAPFLKPLLEAASRQELVRQYLPGSDCDLTKRFTTNRDLFQEPITCALYDALYRYRRADFVRSLANELWPLIKDLPEHAVVVEAGCGPGHVLRELAKRAARTREDISFVGFDPSSEMIYLARRQDEQTNCLNITFLQGDAREARVAQWLSMASLVVARNVLSWVEVPQRELGLWLSLLPQETVLWSREVRRDITDEHLKRRMIESCEFQVCDGQTLHYPPAAYLISILRAFTVQEHEKLLRGCFAEVTTGIVHSALVADMGKGQEAESQFICKGRI